MPDEYARTERGAPVFDLDEIEAKAGAEAKAEARAIKAPRDVQGPAWAGTLTGLESQPNASAPSAPASMPMPAVRPAAPPASSDDIARTVLDQRVAPLPPRIQPPPSRSNATDLYLRLGLMLLAAAILLVAIGVLVAVAYA